MWAAIREILHCDWNPAGAGEFLAIAQGLSGRYRRLVWFAFATQWRMLVKSTDRCLLDAAMEEIKHLHSSLREQAQA
jgi:hypothetical protein